MKKKKMSAGSGRLVWTGADWLGTYVLTKLRPLAELLMHAGGREDKEFEGGVLFFMHAP